MTPEPTTGGVPQGDLKKDQADYDATKAAYAKDPKTKNAYVQATIKLATDTMGANSLESKVKYPAALKLYREALKVDPTNKDAMGYKNLIEGIYKQMGRPIPQ
jgi:tetratricopeptide (TPR) repeat protein